MTTCLRKNCSFRFLFASFVSIYKFVCVLFSLSDLRMVFDCTCFSSWSLRLFLFYLIIILFYFSAYYAIIFSVAAK